MDGLVLALSDIPWCLLSASTATTQWHEAPSKQGQPSGMHGLVQPRGSGVTILAWSSLVTSDRTQGTAGGVSGKV